VSGWVWHDRGRNSGHPLGSRRKAFGKSRLFMKMDCCISGWFFRYVGAGNGSDCPQLH
jgi:hypothetical protein